MITIRKYKFYWSKKEILHDERIGHDNIDWNDSNSIENRSMPWSITRRSNRLSDIDGYYLLISDFISSLDNLLNELFEDLIKTKYYSLNYFKLLFTVRIALTKGIHDKFLESVKEISLDGTTFRLSRKILRGNTGKSVGTITLLYYEV